MAGIVQPLDFDLQALDRGIDVAYGAAAARFLKEVIGYLESPGRLLLAM